MPRTEARACAFSANPCSTFERRDHPCAAERLARAIQISPIPLHCVVPPPSED